MRDATENHEKKMAVLNPGGYKRSKKRAPLGTTIFFVVFFRVTHDRPNEKGATRSLGFCSKRMFAMGG